jgi:hypothetical protein
LVLSPSKSDLPEPSQTYICSCPPVSTPLAFRECVLAKSLGLSAAHFRRQALNLSAVESGIALRRRVMYSMVTLEQSGWRVKMSPMN